MRKSNNFKTSLKLGVLAIAVSVVANSYAQSNTTGNLAGKAMAGATISLTNLDSGAQRVLLADDKGHFSAASLATGVYKVEVSKGGSSLGVQTVEIKLGQGAEISFAEASLEAVQITGAATFKRQIDTSASGTTTTFTSSELALLPVGTGLGSVIQLAPNTTKGDSRYGGSNAPSFGGAGASENAYYLNGFPITNLYVQTGWTQPPSLSIAQTQILTGGYGAEFGRSTGGVVNMVSKRGTNDYVFGVGATVSPAGWRAREVDSYYPVTGDSHNAGTDGKLRVFNGQNTLDESTQTIYIGGPLLKDRLFGYFAYESVESKYGYVGNSATSSAKTTGWTDLTTSQPRYLAKLDWNITDDHSLEYTKLNTQVTRKYEYSGFNYTDFTRFGSVLSGTTDVNWNSPAGYTAMYAPGGGEIDILKYTGHFGDALTLQLLGGTSVRNMSQTPKGYNPSLAQVSSGPANEYAPFLNGLTGYPQPQKITSQLLAPGANDKLTHYRADLEWVANSEHTFRVGVDRNNISAVNGTSQAGGKRYSYGYTATTGTLINKFNTSTLASVTGNAAAQAGYYVTEIDTSGASTPSTIQSAQYIEDRWSVNDRLQLTLGVRNEGFDNRNGDGVSYMNLPTQIAPRFGAAWDVNGDGSMKVFGTAGRYHLPVPTSVAVRQLGASLYTKQEFAYSGVDANGRPTGLTALSPVYSSNNEYGQSKNPADYVNLDLKANSQDEFAIGFEKAISKSLNLGARFTYRSMNSTIDDLCDSRGFVNYAIRNNLPTANAIADAEAASCRLFNPGEDNLFQFDFGDGKGPIKAKITNADMGNFPKVDRTYTAVDVFAEHPFDGTWYGKINYTWSRNAGNMEGQLNSDWGQADVAATMAWDFPEIMANSNGRLPNDRTHQIKAYGYLQLTPELGMGANVNLEAGRPRNCFGNAPDPDMDPHGYGAVFFACNGKAAVRGTSGELEWGTTLDLNLIYKPEAIKGLTLKLDVFNIFNKQAVVRQNELREGDGDNVTVLPTYGYYYYGAPRSAKLSVNYDYKF